MSALFMFMAGAVLFSHIIGLCLLLLSLHFEINIPLQTVLQSSIVWGAMSYAREPGGFVAAIVVPLCIGTLFCIHGIRREWRA